MDRTNLIEKVNEFFGERTDVEALDEVVTEINRVYDSVDSVEKEWRDKYKARFMEPEKKEEKEEKDEEKIVTIDSLFTKKEG